MRRLISLLAVLSICGLALAAAPASAMAQLGTGCGGNNTVWEGYGSETSTTYTDSPSTIIGDYTFLPNVYSDADPGASDEICVYNDDGTSWGTYVSAPDDPGTVTMYPEQILYGDTDASGNYLPISDYDAITLSYNQDLTMPNGGSFSDTYYDDAADTWLNGSYTSSSAVEVMVFTNYDEAPASSTGECVMSGSSCLTITKDGQTYNLWYCEPGTPCGTAIGHAVFTFVNTNDSSDSGTIPELSLYKYLVSNYSSVTGSDPTWWSSNYGMETAGTETSASDGYGILSQDTTSYTVTQSS
jgi:hypothetical protein